MRPMAVTLSAISKRGSSVNGCPRNVMRCVVMVCWRAQRSVMMGTPWVAMDVTTSVANKMAISATKMNHRCALHCPFVLKSRTPSHRVPMERPVAVSLLSFVGPLRGHLQSADLRRWHRAPVPTVSPQTAHLPRPAKYAVVAVTSAGAPRASRFAMDLHGATAGEPENPAKRPVMALMRIAMVPRMKALAA